MTASTHQSNRVIHALNLRNRLLLAVSGPFCTITCANPYSFNPPARRKVAYWPFTSSNPYIRSCAEEASVKARVARFVAIVQSILLLAHLFVYETWLFFWGTPQPRGLAAFRIAFVLLAFSFVAATLLAHRYFNGPVRTFYRIASVWLGIFNFLFIAAIFLWLAYPLTRLFAPDLSLRYLAGTFFGLALLASLYGIVNAASIRV